MKNKLCFITCRFFFTSVSLHAFWTYYIYVFTLFFNTIFIRPSRDGPYFVIGYGGRTVGHPHRFPHNNFSSVYRIFTKLGHMIPLWKGKNPIYFGVIKVKGQGHHYYKYDFLLFDNLYRRVYFVMHTFLVHNKLLLKHEDIINNWSICLRIIITLIKESKNKNKNHSLSNMTRK